VDPGVRTKVSPGKQARATAESDEDKLQNARRREHTITKPKGNPCGRTPQQPTAKSSELLSGQLSVFKSGQPGSLHRMRFSFDQALPPFFRPSRITFGSAVLRNPSNAVCSTRCKDPPVILRSETQYYLVESSSSPPATSMDNRTCYWLRSLKMHSSTLLTFLFLMLPVVFGVETTRFCGAKDYWNSPIVPYSCQFSILSFRFISGICAIGHFG
jgi:hypothetical protein